MKTIEGIRRQLSLGEFDFSRHAFKRVVERNISEFEIRQAGEGAKIIEDYPARGQICSKRLAVGFHRCWSPIAYPGFVCGLGLPQDHYDL